MSKINFKNITDNWKIIAIAVTSLTTIVGASIGLDNRWAKAEEVKHLELRLDQKIIMDKIGNMQERIWKFDDRFLSIDKMPPSVKEEYRQLQKDIVDLKDQLKNNK